MASQIGHDAFHALGSKVLRRLRKFVRRTPRMLAEVFGDGLAEAVLEPQGLIFVAIVALLFVIVVVVLGGALAVLQEAILGGGPPSGLGLR